MPSGSTGVFGLGSRQGHGRLTTVHYAQNNAREEPTPAHACSLQHLVSLEPFPIKPPVYLINGSLEADLIDFTEELRAEALETYGQHTAGPLYTPPALGGNIVRPGWSGGANWWGAAFEPGDRATLCPELGALRSS